MADDRAEQIAAAVQRDGRGLRPEVVVRGTRPELV